MYTSYEIDIRVHYLNCLFHKVFGGWSAWSAWSQCSSSCGFGQQSRKRDCNNPSPAYDGEPCSGVSVVYQNCVEKECPGFYVNEHVFMLF